VEYFVDGVHSVVVVVWTALGVVEVVPYPPLPGIAAAMVLFDCGQ
jgi:hypothetical protein